MDFAMLLIIAGAVVAAFIFIKPFREKILGAKKNIEDDLKD